MKVVKEAQKAQEAQKAPQTKAEWKEKPSQKDRLTMITNRKITMR